MTIVHIVNSLFVAVVIVLIITQLSELIGYCFAKGWYRAQQKYMKIEVIRNWDDSWFNRLTLAIKEGIGGELKINKKK